MKPLPINDLYLFCRVVQAKGYNQAAKSLAQSPATLSRAISSLEIYLGDKLLHRNSQNFQLTTTGAKYFEQFNGLLNNLESSFDSLSQGTSQLKGDIKISCPEIFMIQFFHEWVMQFMQIHPDVNIHSTFSLAGNNYVDDNIDLAIVIGQPQHNHLVQKRLMSRKLVLVASKKYLESNSDIIKVQDLEQHDLLDFAANPYWGFIENKKEIHFVVKAKYRVSNLKLLIDAAIKHRGITLVPQFAVEDLIKTGELTQVLPNVETKINSVYLLFKDRSLMSVRVRALKDYILKKIKEKEKTSPP
ncbi:MAG: LysR family transcriptional regulator [Saccharospirillaceae bacterium]|nr:LysR family transcriptional regulator [Pseudomonadales bacterium]NRB79465.1 LysR family transcriptional regulator [Saccharospirillaceae bacterium]